MTNDLSAYMTQARAKAKASGIAAMTPRQRLEALWSQVESDIRAEFPEPLRPYVEVERKMSTPGDTVQCKVVVFQKWPITFWCDKIYEGQYIGAHWVPGYYRVDTEQYAQIEDALVVAERLDGQD